MYNELINKKVLLYEKKDSERKLVKAFKFNGNGQKEYEYDIINDTMTKYIYNDKQLLINEELIYLNDLTSDVVNLISSVTYKYDENDNLMIKEMIDKFSPDKSKTEYYKNGRISSVVYYDSGVNTEYKYNNVNKNVCVIRTESHSDELTFYENSNKIHVIFECNNIENNKLKEYSIGGNLIKEVEYSDYNKKEFKHKLYQYNKYNIIDKVIIKSGFLTKTIDYECEIEE